MFTIPPRHGPTGSGFTNDNTKLRAEWLNYVGGAFPSALDIMGGGYYQRGSTDLLISSGTSEIKFNAPAAIDPLSLRGYVTIGLSDDVNYAVGVGALTVSSPATFSSTVQFNGAHTFNAAVTFTSNGDIALQSGCAVVGASGSSLTMQDGTTTTLDVVQVNDTLTVATDKNIVLTGTGKVTFAAPRSYRQPCRLTWVNPSFWGPDSTVPSAWPHRVQQTAITNVSNHDEQLSYECDIPAGASVVTVTVWIKPATGHTGLPGNRPQLVVEIYDSDLGTSTATGTAAIANSGVIGTYELRTLLTVTAGVNTLAVPQKVTCRVYGESGTDSLIGMIVDEPSFTFSTPGMNMP